MTDTISVTEQVGEFLAITPAASPGRYTITHLPTGRPITRGSACIDCCRLVAADLASFTADWSTLTDGNRMAWFAALPDFERDKFQLEYWSLTPGCTGNCGGEQ